MCHRVVLRVPEENDARETSLSGDIELQLHERTAFRIIAHAGAESGPDNPNVDVARADPAARYLGWRRVLGCEGGRLLLHGETTQGGDRSDRCVDRARGPIW